MTTSETFRVEPAGLYWAIYWGPTLICTEWTDQEGAQLHCDILEALRRWDDGAIASVEVEEAWWRFRDRRNKGRFGDDD